MGTKVQNLPGYYSMRDLNEESSSCGWPLFYGDKSLTNGQCYNNYLPNANADACSVYNKDAVKRMMLEHEAIFKNQVYELHRLYKIQRDLMNEYKRKESHRTQIPVEASFSTGPLASQVTTEDGQKWHISGFHVGNSTCAKTSFSGVEGIHSPLGSVKVISKQASPFPSPNGCSSKDVEVLESRPSKVRRRMFDLQLPADEYIDTEESEKVSDEKTSGRSLFVPDRKCEIGKEGDVKLFCGNGGKMGSQEDTSRSEQSSKRINSLADLNEPIQMEEAYNSPYVHLQSHNPGQGATECSDLSVASKQKSQFFGLPREQLLNSQHGTDGWTRNNGYLENNGSGKGWYSSIGEAGQAKSNTQPVPQVLKLEKLPLSSQTMLDALSKVREPGSDYLNGRQNKGDVWREKTVSDLHIGERNHEYSSNKHPGLHRPGLFTVAPSSDLSKSWSHSASSWEMASSSLSQKLMSIQTPSCLNASGALNRSSQSHQSNGILEDSWPLNVNSKPNPGFQCDVPTQNGFYPGSLSVSKDPLTNISSISYGFNHNNDCKIIPNHFFNNGSSKYSKGSNSNCNDMKSGKDIDLNVLLPNGSSNDVVPQSDDGIMNRKQKLEEHHVVLPWLRGKTTCKSEVQNPAGESSLFHAASLSNKDEIAKVPSGKFMHNGTSVLCSTNIEQKKAEVNECSSTKKILGVPIFDMPCSSPKKELSSITSPSVSIPNPSDVEVAENNKKKRVLDINLPCDADVLELDKEAFTETAVSETRSPTTEAECRNQIDLNMSMSEDEGSFTTLPSDNTKMKAEIDLEAPAIPDLEEEAVPEEKQPETPPASPQVPQDIVEQPKDDELMKNAAETIVVLSSLCSAQVDSVISNIPSEEGPVVDPLCWFADVVSSCKDNLDGKCDIPREKDGDDTTECSSEGMDYFETMTLKMPETKEEDYMPKPLVPENFKVEETTTTLASRTRKGPARRGRQRRDFQRDILPGLTSLSRHEVTEDLQTFGGLMRATGHSWHSGLTRRSSSRNGSGRGRRRAQVTPSPPTPVATNETSTLLIQHLNNIEVGLEDRSLTGWGKTTRRPRRQRCPAGNPPLIQLT